MAKTWVITGSNRGIGFHLAMECLKHGNNVVISGRNPAAVDDAVKALSNKGYNGQAIGVACDVTDPDKLQALWDKATDHFSVVDIWVNNAGITNSRADIVDVSFSEIDRVINTNLNALMYANKVAISGMLKQGHGKLFNMEGFGSDGMVDAGMSVYGTSKRAVRYFTASMIKEYKNKNIIIGYLNPGVVVTEFITKSLYGGDEDKLSSRKKFLNIIADRPETVAPFLFIGIDKATKSGAAVRWGSVLVILARVVKNLFIKRDPFKGQ